MIEATLLVGKQTLQGRGPITTVEIIFFIRVIVSLVRTELGAAISLRAEKRKSRELFARCRLLYEGLNNAGDGANAGSRSRRMGHQSR